MPTGMQLFVKESRAEGDNRDLKELMKLWNEEMTEEKKNDYVERAAGGKKQATLAQEEEKVTRAVKAIFRPTEQKKELKAAKKKVTVTEVSDLVMISDYFSVFKRIREKWKEESAATTRATKFIDKHLAIEKMDFSKVLAYLQTKKYEGNGNTLEANQILDAVMMRSKDVDRYLDKLLNDIYPDVVLMEKEREHSFRKSIASVIKLKRLPKAVKASKLNTYAKVWKDDANIFYTIKFAMKKVRTLGLYVVLKSLLEMGPETGKEYLDERFRFIANKRKDVGKEDRSRKDNLEWLGHLEGLSKVYVFDALKHTLYKEKKKEKEKRKGKKDSGEERKGEEEEGEEEEKSQSEEEEEDEGE